MPTIEDVIHQQASVVADQIREGAAFAENEQELRTAVHDALKTFQEKAKIQLDERQEKSIGTGRADSVYSHVLIEYERPGKLKDKNTSPGNREAIKQVQDYLTGLVKEEGRKITSLFGVATDGQRFIFIRYRRNNWEIGDPLAVNAHSTQRFLRALTALASKGRAFQPEYLSGDFGSESPLARDGIRTLYQALRNTKNPRANLLRQQWEMLFGQVGGFDRKNMGAKVKQLASHYGISGDPNPTFLMFAVHTYYALFMKLMAAEILNFFNPMLPSQIRRLQETGSSEALRTELRNLEDGAIYRQLGITNLLEGDLFSWYLDAWEEKMPGGHSVQVEKCVRDMLNRLDDYDPVTLSVEPTESRDLLKSLYQELFPKSVRHDLGEYYTPDWLAEHVIRQVGFDGNPEKRVLDPACGSGTFLVLAIQKIREYCEEHPISDEELLNRITANVIGFDLNPLAVMAARLNFIIAIRDLIKFGGRLEIPIYLCDSVMTPAEYGIGPTRKGDKSADLFTELKLRAAEDLVFILPKEIQHSRDVVARYAEELENAVKGELTAEQFLRRLQEAGLPNGETNTHKQLLSQLAELKKKDKNGVWTRIIKNSFAPLFVGRVDYVIGNPPWVNWESLPRDYRESMMPLWEDYGLFSLSRSAGRLGGGKKDLSMLFVYCAVDNYLNEGGKLGFVITQTVFKTKGAGDGFRRLQFQRKGQKGPTFVRMLSVDDLSDFQPFEGATNRTATFVCEKAAQKTEFPVPYIVWRKTQRKAIAQTAQLCEVLKGTSRRPTGAVPVDPQHEASPWLTAPEEALKGIRKVIGPSDYKAYAGSCTWLNGVYWVKVLEKLPNGEVVIENLWDVGKIKVERVQTVIEGDLVYPLLRGRDVERWKAVPSAHIILAQDPETRTGIPADLMTRRYPKTYAYLKRFEEQLRQRSGYRKYFDPKKDPFWSMYNVGRFLLAEHKVIWHRMGSSIQAVYVHLLGSEPVLCQETHTFAAFASKAEALYFAAAINSTPSDLLVRTYSVMGGKSFGSPHVLSHVAIPRHSPESSAHPQLARLSAEAHATRTGGKPVDSIELQIDELAATLWDIDQGELEAMRSALAETQQRKSKASAQLELDPSAD